MRKFLTPLLVATFLTVSMVSPSSLPTAQAAASYEGTVVNTNWLTVRKGPSSNNTAVGWLKKGARVNILENKGTFVYISYSSNKKGYVHKKYLKISQKNNPVVVTPVSKEMVVSVGNGDRLNLRKGPSTTYSIVGKLVNGTIVRVTGKSGSWYYVNHNGRKGYVSSSFLKDIATSKPKPASAPSKNQSTYKVAPGDTLWAVSKKFHVTVSNLKTWNKLSGDIIHVNQVLVVLGSSMSAPALPLKGKVIVLDPGHGGSDPGAIANGIREKDINLSVGLKLRDKLVANGAKVYMTRSSDVRVSYQDRYTLASKVKAQLFFSIHANSNPASAPFGTETYYNSSRYQGSTNPYPTKSAELAKAIQTNLISQVKTRNRGVKEAPYIVLRNNKVPSALVELAFVSNPSDAKLLVNKNFQNKATIGLYNGIVAYFK